MIVGELARVNKMTFPELKKAASEAGLPIEGKKAADLRELLVQHGMKGQPQMATKKTVEAAKVEVDTDTNALLDELGRSIDRTESELSALKVSFAMYVDSLGGRTSEQAPAPEPAKAPKKAAKASPPPPPPPVVEEEPEEEESASDEELEVPDPRELDALKKAELIEVAKKINAAADAGLPVAGDEKVIRHAIKKWIAENAEDDAAEEEGEEEEETEEDEAPETIEVPEFVKDGAEIEVRLDESTEKWQRAVVTGFPAESEEELQGTCFVVLKGDESQDEYAVPFEMAREVSRKPVLRKK